MPQKIEGTLLLEGLVEGPLPPFPDASEKLDQWAGQHRHLGFSVQSDTGRFSALPAIHPIPVPPGDNDASAAVADALADLLRLFPPLEKSQVFSTLRSTEWRHNLEIKTMYAVGPDGRAATHQERAPAKTLAPQRPLATRELLVLAGIGLLVALALFAVSSFFVDYKAAWRRLTATVEPVSVDIQHHAFAPYFRIDAQTLDRKNGTLQLRLTRAENFPLTEADLDRLYDNPPLATQPATAPATAPAASSATATAPATFSLLRRRLALQAVAAGTIHLDLLDARGNFLARIPLRISQLQTQPSLETAIPVPVLNDRLQRGEHLAEPVTSGKADAALLKEHEFANKSPNPNP